MWESSTYNFILHSIPQVFIVVILTLFLLRIKAKPISAFSICVLCSFFALITTRISILIQYQIILFLFFLIFSIYIYKRGDLFKIIVTSFLSISFALVITTTALQMRNWLFPNLGYFEAKILTNIIMVIVFLLILKFSKNKQE